MTNVIQIVRVPLNQKLVRSLWNGTFRSEPETDKPLEKAIVEQHRIHDSKGVIIFSDHAARNRVRRLAQDEVDRDGKYEHDYHMLVVDSPYGRYTCTVVKNDGTFVCNYYYEYVEATVLDEMVFKVEQLRKSNPKLFDQALTAVRRKRGRKVQRP